MILDIDPLEAAIQALLADSTLASLTGGRIASKHRYGEGWVVGEKAIVVRLDDNRPHLYAPVQTARLDVRCYAASQKAAFDLWAAVFEVTSSMDRVAVTTTGGDALVYAFLVDSGVSLLFDGPIGMDYALCFFSASVCELAL